MKLKILNLMFLQQKSAFSLIEISIVLLILSFIAGLSLTTGVAYIEKEKVISTKEKLKFIDDALDLHRKVYGRLPCPAKREEQPEDRDYGLSYDCTGGRVGTWDECANQQGSGHPPSYCKKIFKSRLNKKVYTGAVPIKNLNLPMELMFDAWGSQITYAVPEREVLDSGLREYLIKKEQEEALAEPRRAFEIPQALIITDAFENSVTTAPGGAGYILVSYGQDRIGAHSREKGTIFRECPNGSRVKSPYVENCDEDRHFIDAPYNDTGLEEDYFDDLVQWGVFLEPLGNKETTPLADQFIGYTWSTSQAWKRPGTIIPISGICWKFLYAHSRNNCFLKPWTSPTETLVMPEGYQNAWLEFSMYQNVGLAGFGKVQCALERSNAQGDIDRLYRSSWHHYYPHEFYGSNISLKENCPDQPTGDKSNDICDAHVEWGRVDIPPTVMNFNAGDQIRLCCYVYNAGDSLAKSSRNIGIFSEFKHFTMRLLDCGDLGCHNFVLHQMKRWD